MKVTVSTPEGPVDIGITYSGSAWPLDYYFKPSWNWASSDSFSAHSSATAAATEGRKAWVAAGSPRPPA